MDGYYIHNQGMLTAPPPAYSRGSSHFRPSEGAIVIPTWPIER